MSLIKQLNEAAPEVERKAVMQKFRQGIKQKHGITTSDDAFRSFVEGGDFDPEGMKKLVNQLGKAGFDTSGGYEENVSFLKDLGISKKEWMRMAVDENVDPFKFLDTGNLHDVFESRRGKSGDAKTENEEVTDTEILGLVDKMDDMLSSYEAKNLEQAADYAIDKSKHHAMEESQRAKLKKAIIAKYREEYPEGVAEGQSRRNIRQILEATSFSSQQKKDMEKLISQYIDNDEITSDNVSKMAGDDLEMLEYSPEEVEKMVPYIVKQFNEMKK